ncbi:MAG: aminopeptidase [Elusimicrobiaceae bacterium]|nr:aminopeptidase [Elusimicrobiaceae bacterium]
MLTQKQLDNYADVMVWAMEYARRGGKFKKYDNVLVRAEIGALPLVEAVYERLLDKKYNATVRFMAPGNLQRALYTKADDKQLAYIPAGEIDFQGALNGLIALRAPEDLTALKTVNPARIGKAAVARKPIKDLLDRTEQDGKFSWTLCNFPTQELADKAGLSLKEYANQIVKACFLNEKDPVAKWKEVMKQIGEIGKWLSGLKIERLQVESAHMDFEVLLGEKRQFISGSGCNIPSFEIFTSPDWRGTRGVYFADLSSYRSGNYVKGMRLEFKNGRAVKATAEKGQDFLRKMLAMDRGAAQIGEFSLTDRRFSKIDKFMADILFDENFGGKYGNCHVAIGSSYADTFTGDIRKLDKKLKEKLGYNESALHWDLINTEDKTVHATLKNGKKILIYEKGQFRF